MSDTIEQPTGSALAIVETMTAVQIFAPKSVDSLIERIQREVRSIKRDISTPEGRAAIGRLDRELASRKRKIDELGKQLNSTKRAEIDQVDAERRKWRSAMGALQAEVTTERDAYEAAEAERVKGHTDALARIEAMLIFGELPSSEAIRARRDQMLVFVGSRDWQIDFRARASDLAAEVSDKLRDMLAQAERREAEAAELAKLRAEQAERERQAAEEQRRHREAELARKAAEAARVAAEQEARRKLAEAAQATARAQQQAREAEEKAAAQARQAAADKLAAEQRAERLRIAAEDQAKQAAAEAERRQVAAVEAERLRIERDRAKAEYEAAEAKRKQELEDRKRAENKAHRARINQAAMHALILCGLTEDQAKAVVVAVARGDVPNVSISY